MIGRRGKWWAVFLGGALLVTVRVVGACDVRLNKLSYDDPGTDDAEFIELAVVCSAPANASVDSDATTDVSQAGVAEIRLINGGSNACDAYREISLPDQRLAAAGFITICAAGSELDLDLGCDLTSAVDGPLGSGWLQNGPGDLLELVDAGGTVLLSYVYGAEDSPCRLAQTETLPNDPGPSDGEDEAIVDCGNGYEVRSLAQAPFHALAQCELSAAASGSAAGLVAAPVWPSGTIANGQIERVQTPPAYATNPNAAKNQTPSSKSTPPPSLGCALASASANRAWQAWLALALTSAGLASRRHWSPSRAQRRWQR
jgi:hypothetical protein